jgi:hypothetical protein
LVSISPTSPLGDPTAFCWSVPPQTVTILLLQSLPAWSIKARIISFENQVVNDIINTLKELIQAQDVNHRTYSEVKYTFVIATMHRRL